MNCEQLDEQITLYALGTLEGAELEGLRRHLASGCPACAGRLAEAETTLALLPLATLTPSVEVPAGAKARLDALIAGNESSLSNNGESELSRAERSGLRLTESDTPFPVATPARRQGIPWIPMAVAACLAAGVCGLAMYMPLREAQEKLTSLDSQFTTHRAEREKEQESLKLAIAQQEQLKAQLASVESQLGIVRNEVASERQKAAQLTTDLVNLQTQNKKLADDLVVAENMLKSTQLVTVDLKGQPETPDGKAKLVVDLEQKIWKLYAANLKPLPGDACYEFWLITADGTKVAMGNFKVDEHGVGVLSDKVPQPLPALAAAAISQEPKPLPRDAKEPTGPIQAVGKFQ